MRSTPLENTRDRILSTAERIFVMHGYEGTSLRQITREASVNLAAVNYHFGSKEGLLQEVLRRRLTELNHERLMLLDAAEKEAQGQPLKPSLIITLFFSVWLRRATLEEKQGGHFQKLMGRMLSEPSSFIRTFLADEHSDVMERYQEALIRALPHVSPVEIAWRLHFMLGATAYAIAGIDSLHLVTRFEAQEDQDTANEKLMDRLISFLLGGLRAPLPHPSSSHP